VTIIDLKASPPRVIAEIAAPGSVVAAAQRRPHPDESLALVGSSSRWIRAIRPRRCRTRASPSSI